MPTTVWKFDRLMPRSRRNVSMPRSQLPGSPRISSCSAFGPSMLMVVISRPTPRLSTFSTSATVLSPNQPVVGKFSRNSDLQLLLDRGDEIVEVAAHEQLAARQVHPAELRPAREEQRHLVRRHLVHALLLPDVAHLAAEVAVIRRDERDFVRQRRRTQIRAEDRRAEAELACAEHAGWCPSRAGDDTRCGTGRATLRSYQTDPIRSMRTGHKPLIVED